MTLASRQYTVNGMTCSHCVLSVREEVSEMVAAIFAGVMLPAMLAMMLLRREEYFGVHHRRRVAA